MYGNRKISNLVCLWKSAALLISAIFFLSSTNLKAESAAKASEVMNPESLYQVIQQYAENVSVKNNVISFTYQSVNVYCIWDVNADRMRMVTPIAEASKLTDELILLALKANYHTA